MSRVVCNEKLCSGCLACIVACMDQHYDETEVNVVSPRIYETRVYERTGLQNYVTKSCFHCEDAACMAVCPVQVFERTENGYVVAIHKNRCIGCRKCEKACPHGIPRFDKERKIVKCDGCYVRVACGLEPACVRACNMGVLKVEE